MQPLNCSYCSLSFTLCLWEIQHRPTWELCSGQAWLPTLEFAGIPLSHVPRAGRWIMAANPKPDLDIESHSSSRMLAWLTALHPLTVSNVSPESFFSIAPSCRKWAPEHEAGRAKFGCSLSLACKICAATDKWSLWTAEAAQPYQPTPLVPTGVFQGYSASAEVRMGSSISYVFLFSLHHSCYVDFY